MSTPQVAELASTAGSAALAAADLATRIEIPRWLPPR